jgi:hypothetical protein
VTSTKTLTLVPQGIRGQDGWQTLAWKLISPDLPEFVLTHSVADADAHLLSPPDRADHALVIVLLLAMKNQWDIVVEGKVSPRLLDGLETLQAIWSRWCPNTYRRVRIRAQEECEIESTSGQRPALFAFSGGVDACFSLFRHLNGAAGRNNHKPGAALLVHGMDIPLDRPDFFQKAAERAERMLSGTAIPLIRMRTNARLLDMNWEHTFGSQVAACFLSLQRGFAHGVMASSEPYDALVLPWGSTPLTDPLASTSALQVVHDEAEFDRTEKVDWLVRNTDIIANLRVCWAGNNLSRNCGECEKCVRTMLNFWAKGHDVPAAFPTSLTARLVRSLKISNGAQLAELQTLLKHARDQHNARNEILMAVNSVIRRAKLTYVKHRLLQMAAGALGKR